MEFRRFLLTLAALALIHTLCDPGAALAQPTPTSPAGTATPTLTVEDFERKQTRLLSIQQTIATLRDELDAKQKELAQPSSDAVAANLNEDINQIVSQLEQLENNFVEIASGVDPTRFGPDEEGASDVDFQRQVRALLEPVLAELQEITETPREINRLQGLIAEETEKLEAARRGIDQLERLDEELQNEDLQALIERTRQQFESKQQQYETNISIYQEKLDSRLKSRKSLSETVSSIFQLFFKSRGRNLIIALAASVLFFVLLRKLRDTLTRGADEGDAGSPTVTRLVNVAYLGLTAVGSFGIFLIVLYFFGDWVLLVVAVLILLGILWASKEALPRFWGQIVVMLNMGPVRQGERLVIEGVPYRVETLDFYTRLVNPLLAGGLCRVPIKEIMEMRSRPVDDEELWFPTRQHDVVVLSDGTYGRVALQTPEIVQLRLPGGSVRTYPTDDFVGMSPEVLSDGFRVSVTFGIDYEHQSQAVQEIPETLQTYLEEAFQSGDDNGENGPHVNVEFQEAAASSLNLAVLIDCPGEMATSYRTIGRAVQANCVECATENGWVIPFDQLSVHFEGQGQGPAEA